MARERRFSFLQRQDKVLLNRVVMGAGQQLRIEDEGEERAALLAVRMRGVNVSAIDKHRFPGPDREVVGIDLKEGFAFEAVEKLSLVVPMAVDDVFPGTVAIPVSAERKAFIAVTFALLQGAAERLIHASSPRQNSVIFSLDNVSLLFVVSV
ncbi:hypothetical protein D3C74_228280 [compost metagenome]